VFPDLAFDCFFFSSRRRHTRSYGDWSSDVCSSDLLKARPISLDFERQPDAIGPAPHLATQIRKWLIDWADRNDHDIYSDGLRIRSEERRVGKECECSGST